jgi:hypothetical protein
MRQQGDFLHCETSMPCPHSLTEFRVGVCDAEAHQVVSGGNHDID